eukprot:10425354-Alexandrium_andersonii.AAC.1
MAPGGAARRTLVAAVATRPRARAEDVPFSHRRLRPRTGPRAGQTPAVPAWTVGRPGTSSWRGWAAGRGGRPT